MKARRDAIKKKQVKQKVLARLKNYKLRMPLVNPETLFSAGVWADAFHFVYEYLKEFRGGFFRIGSEDMLTIKIKDLYFMKVYDLAFDFKKAEKLFSEIDTTEYRLVARNDRDYEPALEIGKNFILYDYRGAICFCAGGAVNTDADDIKIGNFTRESVCLRMTMEQFLKLIGTIEKALIGEGSPQMCRVFMQIESQNFCIDVKCLYESSLDVTAMRIFSEQGEYGFLNRQLKSVEPEFIIRMKT